MKSKKEYRELLIAVNFFDQADVMTASGGKTEFGWTDGQLNEWTGNLFGGLCK